MKFLMRMNMGEGYGCIWEDCYVLSIKNMVQQQSHIQLQLTYTATWELLYLVQNLNPDYTSM